MEERRRVCVSNLKLNVNYKHLKEMFEKFGEIVITPTIETDDEDISLGRGIVEFGNFESAVRAVREMNGVRHENSLSTLKVELQQERSSTPISDTNLNIGNLDYTVDEQLLRNEFALFGNIVSVRVMTGKGFGFVQFERAEDAAEAIRFMHEKVINGRKIIVAYNRPKPKQIVPQKQVIVSKTNVYVCNIPEFMNQEALKAMFSKYGTITSAALMMLPDGRHRGFGFVNFAREQDATLAIRHLNGATLIDRKIEVRFQETKK